MSPKTFLIVNPTAGGGRAGKEWPRLRQKLRTAVGPFEERLTEHPAHAREIARHTTGIDRLLVCGGDGTVHEAANGLFDQKPKNPTPFGILSLGTGGDFIKSLGIPKNLNAQIEILKRGKTKKIDAGEIEFSKNGKTEKRIFLNVIDAGLGADVLHRLNASRKRFGRNLAYLSASLQAYFARKCHSMEITIDGETGWREKAVLVAVGNGRCFGGGMKIAPYASLTDGLLDITVVRDFPPKLLALALPALYTGGIKKLSPVTLRKARTIEILSEDPVPLDIDGEPVGTLPLRISVLPAAIEVIVP